MKKFLVLISFLALCSCASKTEAPVVVEPAVAIEPAVQMVQETKPIYKAGDDVKNKYASNFERITTNVRIKEKNPSSISYEYKDVRIDEIGLLASEYCGKQGFYGAILREAYMHKNFSRRATFDCVVLP